MRRIWIVAALGAATFAVTMPAPAQAAVPLCGGAPATIVGTAGPDTITGTAGADVIAAGDGNDVVTGLDGIDRVCLEAGNDTFVAGAAIDGTDIIFGGDGYDTMDYGLRVNPVLVQLDGAFNDGEGIEGDNVQGDVEAVIGGSGDDLLIGNASANGLTGGDGNDALRGGEGGDTLTGGEGKDVLAGEGNSDFLFGGPGNDDLRGGEGSDVAIAEPILDGADTFTGGPDTDRMSYSQRTIEVNVRLDGLAGDGEPGEGDNILPDVENVDGGAGSDTLIGSPLPNRLLGGAGADLLAGGDGDDFLYGEDEADFLFGGGGNDFLLGGDGDDRIAGEAGDDHLYGNAGVDLLNSVDRVVGNDSIDGGTAVDTCLSDPDPTFNC